MNRIRIIAVVIAIIWLLAVYLMTVLGLVSQSAQILLNGAMLIVISIVLTRQSKHK